MTETTETTELTVDARIRDTDEVEPWDGFFWRAVAFVVSLFPTYRDSREGRSTKKQMRIIIVAVGFILLAIGGTADQAPGFWIILGIFIACLAFVIPVEELKMRSWRSTLKKKQQPREKPRWDAGRVDYDGRYLAVYSGDDRVRRINIERQKHDVAVRDCDGFTCLGILPPGAKKAESIWVCTRGDVDVEPQGTIADDEMDRPTKVDSSNWERLWEALRHTD